MPGHETRFALEMTLKHKDTIYLQVSERRERGERERGRREGETERMKNNR